MTELKADAELVAWMTEDGRVATDKTKTSCMPRAASVSFNIPLYTRPAPAPADHTAADSVTREGRPDVFPSAPLTGVSSLGRSAVGVPDVEYEGYLCVDHDGSRRFQDRGDHAVPDDLPKERVKLVRATALAALQSQPDGVIKTERIYAETQQYYVDANAQQAERIKELERIVGGLDELRVTNGKRIATLEAQLAEAVGLLGRADSGWSRDWQRCRHR